MCGKPSMACARVGGKPVQTRAHMFPSLARWQLAASLRTARVQAGLKEHRVTATGAAVTAS